VKGCRVYKVTKCIQDQGKKSIMVSLVTNVVNTDPTGMIVSRGSTFCVCGNTYDITHACPNQHLEASTYISEGFVTIYGYRSKCSSVSAFVSQLSVQRRAHSSEKLGRLFHNWLLSALTKNKVDGAKHKGFAATSFERVVFEPNSHTGSVTASMDEENKDNHALVIPVKCRGRAVCHSSDGAGVWWIKSPGGTRIKEIDFIDRLLQDSYPHPHGCMFERIVLLPMWMRQPEYQCIYRNLFKTFREIDAFFLVESRAALMYSFAIPK
jgi:hypothetical protein